MKKVDVADSLDALLGLEDKKSDSSHISPLRESPHICPPPLDTIKITRLALEKMFILAQEIFHVFETPLEAYCLCIGHEDTIDDILIPRQRVAFTSVHIDPHDLLEIAPLIREKQLNILGWSHSHANFSVFFSGTDDRNQNVLLTETSNYDVLNQMKIKFVYGMTVNVMRDIFGMVSTQYSCNRIEHVQAKIQILDTLPEKLQLGKIKEEIRNEILAKVETSAGRRSKNYHPMDFSDQQSLPKFENQEKSQKIKFDPSNTSESNSISEKSNLSDKDPLIDEFLKGYQPQDFFKETLLSDFLRYLSKKQLLKEKL